LGLRILLEPGRFIVGNGGVLVTRVVHIKQTPVKRFVIVDAAMNDLIRPSLYGSYHEIIPVAAKDGRRKITADVVGPVCESGIFWRRETSGGGGGGRAAGGDERRRVRHGHGVELQRAAASGGSDGEGHRYELVRRRESVKDLISGETIPSWLV
jgi:diaminopimelate decarboxylase